MKAFRFLRLERELQFAFVADDAGGKEAHQGPNAGWVYVLYQTQDQNFENRYHKVGLTTNDPDYRADELWATAVPLPMNVRYALFSDDIHKLEADFYRLTDGIRLKYPRLPGARQPIKPREFVPLSLSEAVRVLNDCAGVDDHYCGLHLVAPDAVDRVRRALGSSFRPTGLTSAVFAAAPPCDAIAVLGQTQQKRIRDMEARAFSAARETLLRVGGIAGLITIGGAAVGTILGSPLDHSVTMGAAGLAGSAALGVLAAQPALQCHPHRLGVGGAEGCNGGRGADVEPQRGIAGHRRLLIPRHRAARPAHDEHHDRRAAGGTMRDRVGGVARTGLGPGHAGAGLAVGEGWGCGEDGEQRGGGEDRGSGHGGNLSRDCGRA